MTQVKRRARPKKASKKKEPRYVVHCGDALGMFSYGGLWKLSHILKKLNEALAKFDFVPGLVLRDGDGQLFKPTIQVHLVPVEPTEDSNASTDSRTRLK